MKPILYPFAAWNKLISSKTTGDFFYSIAGLKTALDNLSELYINDNLKSKCLTISESNWWVECKDYQSCEIDMPNILRESISSFLCDSIIPKISKREFDTFIKIMKEKFGSEYILIGKKLLEPVFVEPYDSSEGRLRLVRINKE